MTYVWARIIGVSWYVFGMSCERMMNLSHGRYYMLPSSTVRKDLANIMFVYSAIAAFILSGAIVGARIERGAIGGPGPDGCIPGMNWCASSDSCIRGFEEPCPIEGGVAFSGGSTLTCEDGDCSTDTQVRVVGWICYVWHVLLVRPRWRRFPPGGMRRHRLCRMRDRKRCRSTYRVGNGC